LHGGGISTFFKEINGNDYLWYRFMSEWTPFGPPSLLPRFIGIFESHWIGISVLGRQADHPSFVVIVRVEM
jgi:hypothetical protein